MMRNRPECQFRIFVVPQLVKYNKSRSVAENSQTPAHGLDYSFRLRLGQMQAAVLGKFYWEITVSNGHCFVQIV